MNTMIFVWLAATIAFIVVEVMTVQLVTVWFAVGSFASLIACLLHASVGTQIWIFIGVSIVALLATRPFVKKITAKKVTPTNADMAIGQTAVVTEQIDNLSSTGAVKLKGAIWSARSNSGDVLPVGTHVTVIKIDGVKLIVDAAAENNGKIITEV